MQNGKDRPQITHPPSTPFPLFVLGVFHRRAPKLKILKITKCVEFQIIFLFTQVFCL